MWLNILKKIGPAPLLYGIVGLSVKLAAPYISSNDWYERSLGLCLAMVYIFVLAWIVEIPFQLGKLQVLATATASASPATSVPVNAPKQTKESLLYKRALKELLFSGDNDAFLKEAFTIPKSKSAFQRAAFIFFVFSFSHSIVEISYGGVLLYFGIVMIILSSLSWDGIWRSLHDCFDTFIVSSCVQKRAAKNREKQYTPVEIEDLEYFDENQP